MRILLVNSLYPPYVVGGAEVSCQKLAIELARQGHCVFVLTTSDTDVCEERDGVYIIGRRFKNIMSFWRFKKARLPERILYKLFDVYNPLNRRIIDQVIKQVRPDVIHANTIYGISPVLWCCGKKKNIPVVQTVRDYYLMCPKANLMKKNGNCTKPGFLCKVFRRLHIKWAEGISAVTAPSQYTLGRFLSAGYFQNSVQETIYNAIDCDWQRFERLARARLAKQHEVLHVAYIGSFIESKGIEVLLKAIEQMPVRCVFHFMGKGRLEDKIKKLIEAGYPVIIEGFLDEDALNQTLEKMDLLVCPSVWPEPFGRVIIDAYKSCLPVIATNCGGIPELIEDGVTGRIIDSNDPEAIVTAVLELGSIGMTEPMAEAMRKQLHRFSLEQQAKAFEELFLKVATRDHT